MAWREKLTLNLLISGMCGAMLFYIIGLTRIICPITRVLSQGEIDGKNTLESPTVAIFGSYYKIEDILKTHIEQKQYINAQALKTTTLGKDVSAMFYKTTMWAKYCPKIPQPSGWDNIRREISAENEKTWYPHFGTDRNNRNRPIDYLDLIRHMKRGNIARNNEWIQKYLAQDPERLRVIVAY